MQKRGKKRKVKKSKLSGKYKINDVFFNKMNRGVSSTRPKEAGEERRGDGGMGEGEGGRGMSTVCVCVCERERERERDRERER